MASVKSPPRLQVQLKPSRVAAALIGACVIASAALIAWLPGEWWWRATIAAAVGAYGLWLLHSKAYAAMRRSIVSIEVGADLRATFTERSGRRLEGNVQHGSYVGSMLTTIVVRPTGSRSTRSVAIFPDMLHNDDFRRLRTLLRLGRAAE